MTNYTMYPKYNMTPFEDGSGLNGIVTSANDLTGGVLGILLLCMVFLVGYTGGKRVSPNEEVNVGVGLISSGFIGGLLWFAHWITWYIAFIPVILLIIMIIYRSLNSGGP